MKIFERVNKHEKEEGGDFRRGELSQSGSSLNFNLRNRLFREGGWATHTIGGRKTRKFNPRGCGATRQVCGQKIWAEGTGGGIAWGSRVKNNHRGKPRKRKPSAERDASRRASRRKKVRRLSTRG